MIELLGFSAYRPLYQAWVQDAALVWQSELKAFPKFCAQAKAKGAEIYFSDELGLRSDCHTGTT